MSDFVGHLSATLYLLANFLTRWQNAGMERTEHILEVVNGGNTCATCRHLDRQPNEGSLCRRYPPQTAGGIIMAPTMGAREPQPAILKNNFFPAVGRPELQWCGEHSKAL